MEFEGTCRGIIAPAPKGKEGFGYDPIFYYPPEGKTVAELPEEVKQEISHRGKAARAAMAALKA
jgi:XTP/dITP diphosphohydrolase